MLISEKEWHELDTKRRAEGQRLNRPWKDCHLVDLGERMPNNCEGKQEGCCCQHCCTCGG